jgi:hypothetical protein
MMKIKSAYIPRKSIASAEQHPYDNENKDGTEAATAPFAGAPACEYCPEKVVHFASFLKVN